MKKKKVFKIQNNKSQMITVDLNKGTMPKWFILILRNSVTRG